MGWNDRLPEDPYIPYANQDDQDAYDNWQMYLESCRLEGLTSQNVDPATVLLPGAHLAGRGPAPRTAPQIAQEQQRQEK